MKTIDILILINYICCLLIILHMVFISKKKFERIAAWTVFLFIPFVGLFSYLLVGAGLNIHSKSMIKKKSLITKEYSEHIKKQIQEIKNSKNPQVYSAQHKELIILNLNNCDSILYDSNQVEYFNNGETTVERMMEDIKNAKSSIHAEFYIFANDKIGKEFKNLLIQKAKEGVEVRLLYDAVGSLTTGKLNFVKLKKAGGQIAEFFPPFLNIKLLNINANYRNHRKIVVIDGKIGYTGGTNIREDHLGHKKSVSPWRDTNVRVEGKAVHSLQNIFLSDWRYSTSDKNKTEYYLTEKYFPVPENTGNVAMQVISSGPDNISECIKECMIKMIVSAKHSIKIQTPYFIPDDAFMGAIKLAILSGVTVEVMIPKKVDHWSVHFASMSYINDLLKLGGKVHIYNGFIHSKVLMVDDKVLTLGSCNIDIRSFSLNFEDNVVIYNSQKVLEYSKMFDDDLLMCSQYTEATRKKKNPFVKMMTCICRLFSSIL